MIKPLDFAQGFDSGYSKDFVNRRCINVYRNVATGGALSDAQIVGVPGIREFSDCLENTCRGLFTTKDRLFSVNGNYLFEYFEYGGYVSRGVISSDQNGELGTVRFASNGLTIAIVTGNTGYFYTLATNTLTEITDTVFTDEIPVVDVTYKDGRFFYLSANKIFQGSLVTALDSDDDAVTVSTASITNSLVISLPRNGVACSGGVAYFPAAVNITITTTSNDTAGYWLIQGKDSTGAVVTENLPGANSSTVTSVGLFTDCEYIFYFPDTAPVTVTNVKAGFYSYGGSGTGFNVIEYAQAESNPDNQIAIITSNNYAYVLGESTIELFQSVDSNAFSLQPVLGATIQKGCIAKSTVIPFQGGIIFLGGDVNEGVGLYLCRGSEYKKISNNAIDYYLQTINMEDIVNATCWTYQAQGSSFLVLDVADASFVYDLQNSQRTGSDVWHERQSGVINWIGFSPFRAKYSASAFNKVLCGDKDTGQIGEISFDVFTEYDEIIQKGLTTQPFDSDAIRLNEIKASVNAGGKNYSETYSPVVFTSVSTLDVYSSSPSTAQTLSDDGRVVTIINGAIGVSFTQYTDKLTTIDYDTETGFGLTLSRDNTWTYELIWSPINFDANNNPSDNAMALSLAYNSGTGMITPTTFIMIDGNDIFSIGTAFAYAGEELFVSTLNDTVSVGINVYLGSSASTVHTQFVDGSFPVDLYLSGYYGSGGSTRDLTITIKKYPINPNNCALFTTTNFNLTKGITPYSFELSAYADISSDGYSFTSGSGQGASGHVETTAITKGFTIQPDVQYIYPISLDVSGVGVLTDAALDFYLVDNQDLASANYINNTVNGLDFYCTYEGSTGVMTIEPNIILDGSWSTGLPATVVYDSEVLYFSFEYVSQQGHVFMAVFMGDNKHPIAYFNQPWALSETSYVALTKPINALSAYSVNTTVTISTADTQWPDATILADYDIEEIPEPTIEMSYSIDGGRTFNTPVARGMGDEGNYSKQVKWPRLGIVDQARVLRFYSDSRVKFAINKIEVDVDGDS